MSQEQLAARWVLSGRVQGVGFRWYVLRQAEALDIVGWAANLPDGRVEVVGKGTREAIDLFEAALREGPRMSRVENVDKTGIPHEHVHGKMFHIR
ncbi:MAG: acylphosphatase [Gemmatimonadales bacterium]